MSEPRNDGEFHRADPAYRRRMQLFLAVLIVAGAVGLGALQVWLGKIAAHGAGDLDAYQASLNRPLAGLCLLLAVGALGFAQWLFRIARATKAGRRWPPSSMRTYTDVRIRYLTAADSLGTRLRSVASVLAFVAVLLAGWTAWLSWAS